MTRQNSKLSIFEFSKFLKLKKLIINQKTNNPNNQSPQKPSFNNVSDEKKDNETTSDKFRNGSENVEGKNVETPPSRVLIDESKTNSAATASKEKQKDEVLSNQVVDFHSYSAKEKKTI